MDDYISEDNKMNIAPLQWVWVLISGMLLAFLGAIAFSLPVVSTIGVTYGLASVLIAGGIILFFHAVQLRHESGGVTRFFQSLLSLITGLIMVRYPDTGMMGISLALSFYFFLAATAKWIVYMSVRPARGWGWGIASSMASFALGVLIIVTFPFSALWIPGALLGIDLVVAGAAIMGASFSIRKISHDKFQPLEGT
jgi:uncharacterized membrane protein HdeD (DUF308 family)